MREQWVIDPRKGADWHGFAVRVALGFPESYRVGMANLGFLWVQRLFNSFREVRCDRFFDADRQLKRNERLTALETGRPLSDYDVIAFSLPYEGGYAAVPRMLMLGGVEPVAGRRAGGPLVIAGGAAASANPEPIADFLDAVVVGEAEAALEPFVKLLISARYATRGGGKKDLSLESLRRELRSLPGVYIPSDFRIVYREDGTVEAVEPAPGAPEKVTAVHLDKITTAAHSPVISRESAFPNRFLVEASRGCPHRCRFCLAAWTSGGYREAERVEDAVAAGLKATSSIGVIGTAFTRSAALKKLCEMVSVAGGNVSFSSIRMDAAALRLLSEIGPALDLESIAVAPEVAVPKLAGVIGKDIFSDLESFVAGCPLPSLKKLKLYFLMGVPGETDADVAAIADMAIDVQRRTGWEIAVSVTPMIPKPFTPMQWEKYPEEGALKAKKELLRKRLSGARRVSLKVESLRGAREQAVLARGDRRLGAVLLEAAKKTVTENTPVSLIPLMRKSRLDQEFYTARQRGGDEVFPWDMISHGTRKNRKNRLYEQFMKAADAAKKI